MERKIKVEYNPQRTYAVQSGEAHDVGLLSSGELSTLLASVSKIYCSPSGNDASDGLTDITAVRTLARAIELAVTASRDAVVLMPGTHSYLASHNTYGKQIIAMQGAKMACIGTYLSASSKKYNFDTQIFFIEKLAPSLLDYSHLSGYVSGAALWFTGRSDIPTDAEKANRLYMPAMSSGGVLRLCRTRLYLEAGQIQTPSATEYEWEADAIPDLEVWLAGLGYGSASFPSGDVNACLINNHYNGMRALTDGLGRVFVVTNISCDLSGGTDYRNLTVIWYNGAPQYFYETLLAPSEGDNGPQCYGNADTPGPMLRTWYLSGGGGYTRDTAIQPNKRIGDTDYEFSVTGPALSFSDVRNVYAKVCAVYRNGVPMFSTYLGDGKCYSAQQMSDEFETAGSYASLPTYVTDILESPMRATALALGFQETQFSLYNKFNSRGDLVCNVNPNSPFMTAMSMTATDFIASAADPDFFESAEALCDNLFYGGALINIEWFAQMPCVTILSAPPYNLGGDLMIPVHGLGVNSRLQNCTIAATDVGSGESETNLYPQLRNRSDRIFVEAWFDTPQHVPVADSESSTFSNFIRAQSVNVLSISKKPSGDVRVKNSVMVGLYLLADNVELWHVSAVACAYSSTNGELVYACNFAFFSGYYLTPDASPMNIQHSVIREALAQNLIPPGSTLVDVISGDPLFKSSNNPYDLRLQSTSKGDVFDSVAIAYSPETSFFGGQREAGAYDDKGQLTITWDEFTIDFPFVMPIGSDRVRLTNRRRDGVKSKISVSKNTVTLSMVWQAALSEGDLRNLERLQNSDESLARIYFRPIAEPSKHLLGHIDQAFKHGAPMALLSGASSLTQIDFDCAQPASSLYDYL